MLLWIKRPGNKINHSSLSITKGHVRHCTRMLLLHVSGQTFILYTSYISLSPHPVFLVFDSYSSAPLLLHFQVIIILLLVFHSKCSCGRENRKYLS